MTGIKRRLRALEEKLGANKEPITIVVRRIITSNPKVARGEVEPSEDAGDRIYERTVVIESGARSKK